LVLVVLPLRQAQVQLVLEPWAKALSLLALLALLKQG
jgi:hypothetical protein